MVKTTDQSSGSSVAMTDESNFLKSIDAFQKKGVECGTVKVTGMYPDRFHDNKSSIGIELSIISDMKKCRAVVKDGDGNPVMTTNDVGDKIKKIEIIENPKSVFIFPKVVSKGTYKLQGKEFELEEGEVLIGNQSKWFGLFNEAFKSIGDVSDDNTSNLICTIDEIQDAFAGYEFSLTVEEKKTSFGNSYLKPVIETID